jgi:hypothetical protein
MTWAWQANYMQTANLYEMNFEIDEPQFTQRESLGVVDLPVTTIDTWYKRDLISPFEFTRDFRGEEERLKDWVQTGSDCTSDKVRTYKVFQRSQRRRLMSVLDVLCLGGIKAVLDASLEIRFATQFPELLCASWTDVQLWNLNRNAQSENPIILYVDAGELQTLTPPTPYRGMFGAAADEATLANAEKFTGPDPFRVEVRDLSKAMRDLQLTSVTMIDWPGIEERVIAGLKRIIAVRGHRGWED